MFYLKTITVPKNTPINNPYKETLLAVKGVIHRVIIVIPPGHLGLTGLRILHESTTIAPSNPDGWFRGDDVRIDYNERYEIKSSPALIEFQAYNLDQTFDHEFVVGIGILPKEYLPEKKAKGKIIEKIKSLLAKI